MSGDVHVRFCEDLGGRFPRAARLIITGVSEALLADEIQPLVEQFLMERGLTLSREKTQIVHIETGFDFLGFNMRKYHGKPDAGVTMIARNCDLEDAHRCPRLRFGERLTAVAEHPNRRQVLCPHARRTKCSDPRVRDLKGRGGS